MSRPKRRRPDQGRVLAPRCGQQCCLGALKAWSSDEGMGPPTHLGPSRGPLVEVLAEGPILVSEAAANFDPKQTCAALLVIYA